MQRRFTYIIAALALPALGGCVTMDDMIESAEAENGELSVTGNLAYRERIALPPSAVMRVTLNDISRADAPSTVLAEKVVRLDGQQVPLPFSLSVNADELQPRRRYSVRGTVEDANGSLMWTTDTAHMIDTDDMAQNLGTLGLIRVAAQEENSSAINREVIFQCGEARAIALFPSADVQAQARPEQNRMKLTINDREYFLGSVRSASGAKFEGRAGSNKIMFWNKGNRAWLEIADKSYPECIAQDDVKIDQNLTGSEWVVEDINNRGIIDNSRVTLNFSADGTLSGRASCNNYSGAYEAGDKVLTVPRPFAVTRKACPPALMNQEQKFLSIVGELQSYSMDATGALILKDSQGRTLTARR